jgi:hypothetical protein
MKVVTLDKKSKEDERKNELLEVINEIKRLVENGEIKELVACTVDQDGSPSIHVSVLDLPGGVGLFEIGKHMFIELEA